MVISVMRPNSIVPTIPMASFLPTESWQSVFKVSIVNLTYPNTYDLFGPP